MDFIQLSKHLVKYAGGLPLALERSTIERLKRDSSKEILNRLQLGFDGLEQTEKNIFLDIACFFDNLDEKDLVIKVLDGCNFSPLIGIDVLIKKSLIKDCGNHFSMHDLLREMGRKIVQKSLEPGKCSRLWEANDVSQVLTNNTNLNSTQYPWPQKRLKAWLSAFRGMISDEREHKKTFTLCTDGFLKMKKLRLLKVFYLQNWDDLKYLSNELRLLKWHEYPFKSLPLSFQPDNLVALLLPYSRIEQLWEGKRPLYKLKLINLEGSANLIKTPDFAMAPNLENLILEGCTKMVYVHPSIGVLKRLKLLNLSGCKSLRSINTRIRMESLETFILSGCSNLQRFPEIDGKMKCLLNLYLDGTSIEELHSSIGYLSNLVLLNLKDCSNLVSLPSNLNGCKSLKILNLSGCSKVETLPKNLQQVEVLEELELSGTAIARNLPSFIFQFKNLKILSGCKESIALMLPHLSGLSSLIKLDLSYCNLGEDDVLSHICCLSSLKELDISGNNFLSLPATIGRLPKLYILKLSHCGKLKSLPEAVIASVDGLVIDGCASLEVVEDLTAEYKKRSVEAIRGINCYKLVEKNNALTLLKIRLKANVILEYINILVPGSEIPEWFSHHTDEIVDRTLCLLNEMVEISCISMEIPLPPIIGNDRVWMGVAFCCLFVSVFNDGRQWEGESVEIETNISGRSISWLDASIGRKGEQQVKKDRLWLHYWCRNDLYRNFKKPDIELKHQICEIITACNKKYFKLKKCGVRLVYEQDLEEFE
ncbi:hypothetical protein PTKIN_Ptkin18bG0143500 [Pterospermum kingtungense]